ncbi:hypothetical protein DB2_41 [Octadecabacter Antarctic DB virus 2]|nr:hypothetical protein DB2_41 [Octadecabacter Antarctic DB virus 2]
MNQRMIEADAAMNAAATEYWTAFSLDLDTAKTNLTPEKYEQELIRIAWVSRSNVSQNGPSTTNLKQRFEREIAMDLLHRFKSHL